MTRFSHLFRMHDEQGVPLQVSLLLCMSSGVTPNLDKFFFDAVAAGWNPDSAYATIEGACRENDYPFDLGEFKERLAATWQRCGRDFAACGAYLGREAPA